MNGFHKGSYGYDLEFLEEYLEPVELFHGKARVLISPKLQGRIMTSTASGKAGKSYGWINYDLFESEEINPRFNPFGGEERFWLGPEGGPWSIFFKPGAEQVFTNWKVPEGIDTEPFDMVEKNNVKAVFSKTMELQNYKKISLTASVERTVRILTEQEVTILLGITPSESLDVVAFESQNILKNAGQHSWDEKNGTLSVWLLSMFNPSEEAVAFIPFREGSEAEFGKKVTDDYFGKVPPERLLIRDNILFFRTDGAYRSKIGIPPQRALPWCGSYDPAGKVLTLLWYSLPDAESEYVNSVWGDQDNPLSGDVVNAYNDGPADDGTVMGPFYEIESSSPAALLKAGESIHHTQRIFHIAGDEKQISLLTENLFNLKIDQIKSVF